MGNQGFNLSRIKSITFWAQKISLKQLDFNLLRDKVLREKAFDPKDLDAIAISDFSL